MALNNSKDLSFISVVISTKNITKNPTNVLGQLLSELIKYYDDYEVIIINSEQKNSEFSQCASEVLEKHSSIRLIDLAYSVAEEIEYLVGMETALGDYIITFSPDSDPITIITHSVNMCKEGANIVIGVDESPKKSIFYKTLRYIASAAFSAIQYNIPKDATHFRCVSRSSLDMVLSTKNSDKNIYLKMSQSGLKSKLIKYKLGGKKDISKSVFDFFNILVRNSTKPLRWMGVVGITSSFLSFIYSLYSFVVAIFNNTADGWASISVFMSFMFMLVFILISFVLEYLGIMLENKNGFEKYWVVSERTSKVMIKEDRVNVLELSE